ncbi:MAG: rhodanese-like domain-containing protein [Bacteroidota bacterium]|nr:MAG: rhodanese-like domain-containing protein [Bacteroidota bacterium]
MQIITAEELKQRQTQGESLNILDVREPGEYQEINMGAKLIPLGQILAGQIDDIEAWRDQELIVHCRSGMRSMQACMMLDSLGFSNTKNLAGGILAWQALS